MMQKWVLRIHAKNWAMPELAPPTFGPFHLSSATSYFRVVFRPKKPAAALPAAFLLCLNIILVALASGSKQIRTFRYAMRLNFTPDEALVLLAISCSSSLSY
jgi:hypothetical protein